MFWPLFWAIIRSQLNLRKLYSVIYKINSMYVKFNEISLNFTYIEFISYILPTHAPCIIKTLYKHIKISQLKSVP